MKLMFSMPIHECPETVLDTLCNLRAFHDDFGVVLHISNQFDYSSRYMKADRFWEVLKSFPNLYVNPQSYDTYWNGPGVNAFVNIHSSNFMYLEKIGVEFEYIVFLASNELYVKKGLYDFIKDYDFGNNYKNIIERPEWIQRYFAQRDEILAGILEKIGGKEIYGSQFEGSFYRKEVFAKIAHTIADYTGNNIIGGYACEEIYYPTVCYHLFGTKKHYHDNTTYISWERFLQVDMEDVQRCSAEGNYFSVKRIQRDFNDSLREYIRCELGKYGTKKGLNLPWSIEKNDEIDESRYILSEDLLALESKRSKGEKDVYDVLSFANGCYRAKDAEYLTELLLCDVLGDIHKALRHLAETGLTKSFYTRLLCFEITGDIEVAEEELIDQRKCLLLLRMLARRKELEEYVDVIRSINSHEPFNILLLEAFIRIQKDERLKFFSLKNGRELWLHYNDKRLEEKNIHLMIPQESSGRKWPFAEKENNSPFAMFMTFTNEGIFFSIEFCVEDVEVYSRFKDIEANSKLIDMGKYKIFKFIEGTAHVDGLKTIDYNVNMILDIFCDIGGELANLGL